MGTIASSRGLFAGLIPLGLAMAAIGCRAQTMPATEGETLSGHRVVLAKAIQGHASIVIGSFSKDAGSACEEWSKAIQGDSALASVPVYQAANLERAPDFVRGMIKSSMRKQMPVSIQDRFVIFTQGDAEWRSYFGVTTGQVRWHGHGTAASLEPLVKAAFMPH
jgi:hypothetical protein